MKDSTYIRLPGPDFTRSAGGSLARTLYGTRVTVLLRGDLGAGKTTFLQGFAGELGVKIPLTSPTYALEQRYSFAGARSEERGTRELIHIDLYRLTTKEAIAFVRATEDFEDIRVIEWADRLTSKVQGPTIVIELEEGISKDERLLTINFCDIPLPTRKEILEWRKQVSLPEHIARHCDAVADVAVKLGASLLMQGMLLRPLALRRAAEAHDLLRFVDFRGASHVKSKDDPIAREVWERIREKYAGLRHEAACASLLREKGFSAIAEIVSSHGLRLPPVEHSTTEQKLLFYADKRVALDSVVTLEGRFRDFTARYGNGHMTNENRMWYEEAVRMERELFPEGAPL